MQGFCKFFRRSLSFWRKVRYNERNASSGPAKKEKLFLALSLAAVVLCTVLAFGFAVPLQAAEPQVLPDTTGLEQYMLVDLNTADLSALCTLPGVGEKRAQTILDYRTQNGPFERVEDAANVPGLTQTIVDSWAGMATVS